MDKQKTRRRRKFSREKAEFQTNLSEFAKTLGQFISPDGEWTIKGFIDAFKNIYTISADTRVISKILELHLFPYFLEFANNIGYSLELAEYQNWYPDFTFVNKANKKVKFALDLKTTYVNEKQPGFCNGFTLGSHGGYFLNRDEAKNALYPYNQYSGHFCLGIIYSRRSLPTEFESRKYSIDELEQIPSAINNVKFFATEKWKIASDRAGSGNSAIIGSIKNIDDILSSNGVFAKAGEEIFDDYWANFGRVQIDNKSGGKKLLSSFDDYIDFRGLSTDIKNTTMAVH